jgi:hypothetical protein
MYVYTLLHLGATIERAVAAVLLLLLLLANLPGV